MNIKELCGVGGGIFSGELICPKCDHVQSMGVGCDPRDEESSQTWSEWAATVACNNCGHIGG